MTSTSCRFASLGFTVDAKFYGWLFSANLSSLEDE